MELTYAVGLTPTVGLGGSLCDYKTQTPRGDPCRRLAQCPSHLCIILLTIANGMVVWCRMQKGSIPSTPVWRYSDHLPLTSGPSRALEPVVDVSVRKRIYVSLWWDCLRIFAQ